MASTIDHNYVLRTTDRWSEAMPAVTVSPKFQVVIPKEIREAMNIAPGQKVQMMIYKGNIVLVPVLPMKDTLGIAKGIDTTIERDDDRI